MKEKTGNKLTTGFGVTSGLGMIVTGVQELLNGNSAQGWTMIGTGITMCIWGFVSKDYNKSGVDKKVTE